MDHGVCMYVCVYVVCHTRAPAKAVGRNEIPVGRNTGMVPSNTVLDRDRVPHEKGIIWQFAAMLPNAK